MRQEASGAPACPPGHAQSIEACGGARLLVAQDGGDAAAARLYAHLGADGEALGLLLLRGSAAWAGGLDGCGAVERLAAQLVERLATASAGIRLYACGDEAFVWSIYRLARGCGLSAEAIILQRSSRRRDLYCEHCAGVQSIGSEQQILCRHCGVRLLVREHFSPRLGAYLGVCLDSPRSCAAEPA